MCLTRVCSKCDWTPFFGQRVRGVVKRVVLRGQVVFVADHPDDKTTLAKVLCAPGYGQSIAKSATALALPALPALPAPLLPVSVPVKDGGRLGSLNQWKGLQHFLTVDVLTKDMLRHLFHVADELALAGKRTNDLAGKRLALLFFEASTR